MKLVKSEKGSALVLALIVAGLLGLIALALTQLSSSERWLTKKSALDDEMNDLEFEVKTIMQNMNLCVGAASYDAGNNFRAGAITAGATIGNLTIQNFKLSGVTASAPLNSGTLILVSQSNSSLVSVSLKREIPIKYSADATGNITDCEDISASPGPLAMTSSICTTYYGVWSGSSCDFCAGLGGTTVLGICTIP